MRKYFYAFILLVLAAVVIFPQTHPGKQLSSSGRNPSESEGEVLSPDLRSNLPGLQLQYCYSEALDIRFLCDFGWRQYGVGKNLVVFIREDPQVSMNILKVPMDVLFIDQLNRDKLEGLQRYEDGFAIEQGLEVSGLKAIKVKAFLRGVPQTRLSDYYFIHQGDLYAIMFSVTPKENWNEYQFLFEDMVDHLEFWRPPHVVRSLPQRVIRKIKSLIGG